MTMQSKLFAPETRSGLLLRFKRSVIGTAAHKLTEFIAVFRLYRKAGHRLTYCARIAWGIVVRKLPF